MVGVDYTSPIEAENKNYRNVDNNITLIVSYRGNVPDKEDDYTFGFIPMDNTHNDYIPKDFTTVGYTRDANKIVRYVVARRVPEFDIGEDDLDFSYEFLIMPRRKIVQLPLMPAFKNNITGEIIMMNNFIISCPPVNTAPPRT